MLKEHLADLPPQTPVEAQSDDDAAIGSSRPAQGVALQREAMVPHYSQSRMMLIAGLVGRSSTMAQIKGGDSASSGVR